MAVSRKSERELIRKSYLEVVSNFLAERGDEVLLVKSNEIAIPVVGCEGNEDFLVITFKVPTGANKGTEPYDGYEMAQDYKIKLESDAEKAKAKAEKKAKKAKRDAELRKRKAEIAEKGKQKYLPVGESVDSPFLLSTRARLRRSTSQFRILSNF